MKSFNFYQKQIYNRINNYLLTFLNKLPLVNSKLIEVIKYGTLLGGKRLRPFLTYAVGSMFGISKKKLDAPAAAVECIHAYSLIHDDLPSMDNDFQRRNKPACHIKYGEGISILAGDSLQALAFHLLSTAQISNINNMDRIKMISELAQASGIIGMCGGQSLDLYTKNKNINYEQLKYIYKHKTVALIRAAVRLGAYAAGSISNKLIPILDKYSESFGLAFQIQDDILDFLYDKNKITKKQQYNFKNYKCTNITKLESKLSKKIHELYQDALLTLETIQSYSYNTNMLKAITNFVIKHKN
ncbi:Farnesyl diphosphate synthase [Candidatus Providencia siddallii]|uniref:Farnesyl diphosphate synthase n=1 Tax=Candidatus Providencia siddallii TaxID=1715285 RepID=A0ABP1CDZ6_9GAMM